MKIQRLAWLRHSVLWTLLIWGFNALAAIPSTILVVGDSISAGYGLPLDSGWVKQLSTHLSTTAPCWRVINASITGDTTSGGLARLPELIATYQPQIVMLELGGNDALQGLNPTLVQQNLTAMANLAKATATTVILIEIPVLPNYGPAYTQAVQQAFMHASQDTHTHLITTFFAGLKPPPSSDFQTDNIHPSLSAQSQLLTNILPHLRIRLVCKTAR